MKSLFCLLICLFVVVLVHAQGILKLTDLAVPSSPAFILTDISPTLIQSPNSPKKFILGLAQNYEKSSGGFPENYSAEFVPYWFAAGQGRNIYRAVGLKTATDANGNVQPANKGDIFSGLKFTSLSLALINKDLLPDAVDNPHKVFALGVRTILIKIQQAGYVKKMKSLIERWHPVAQHELILIQDQILSGNITQKELDSLNKLNVDLSRSVEIAGEISKLSEEKPAFSWDFSGAYSSYGIGEQDWTTGRTGIWTSISSYLPLASAESRKTKNYFNLNLSFRSIWDNYTKSDLNLLVKSHSLDFGGKAALEFDDLSLGVESLNRYFDKKRGSENRTVGLLNYKIEQNVVLSAAFGKNFQSQSRSIAMFGINWGFGSEKLALNGNQ